MSDGNESDTGSVMKQRAQELAGINPPTPAAQQALALKEIGTALATLTTWITGGGLVELLANVSKANGANGILNGLAAHDGRNALDARVITQNSIEIVHVMEAVRDKFAEHLAKKNNNELDPDLHDAEKDFKEFKEKQNARKTDSPD